MLDPGPEAIPKSHPTPRGYLYHRHALIVRITHWSNAIALAILLMSGLQIFNAHPSLSWGDKNESRFVSSGERRDHWRYAHF